MKLIITVLTYIFFTINKVKTIQMFIKNKMDKL